MTKILPWYWYVKPSSKIDNTERYWILPWFINFLLTQVKTINIVHLKHKKTNSFLERRGRDRDIIFQISLFYRLIMTQFDKKETFKTVMESYNFFTDCTAPIVIHVEYITFVEFYIAILKPVMPLLISLSI